MNKVTSGLMALMLLLVVGCADDMPTPIEATQAGHDDAVAKIVAGALGYESNGLAAMMADMVVAGTGGTLRDGNPSAHAGLMVTQNDSIFDPVSMRQSLVLACERNQADTYSEWKLQYTINYGGMQGTGAARKPASALSAETHADGTYRNSILTVQGNSDGTIGFVRTGSGRDALLSGEYTWQGTTAFRQETVSYGDVMVTFNWNRLHVQCSAAGQPPVLSGRCDVTIRANGPDGAFSRNGSVTFDGSGEALLSIGGKRFLVSVRSPELLREA